MSGLPWFLAEVEKAAGIDAALKLAQVFGGVEISLSAAKSSALARAVGPAAAQAIVQAIGRGKVLVPMATARGARARRASAAQLMANGASDQTAALACDVHIRTAKRIRAKVKKQAGDQGDLFG